MTGLTLRDGKECSECGRTDRPIKLRNPRLCINCYRRRLRAEGRLKDDNRRVGLRGARKKACDRVDCPTCDGKMSRGKQRCETCRQESSREREARFVALRGEGLNNRQIAAQEGVAVGVVAVTLSRAKQRGVQIAPSPYWRRNKEELVHA